MIHFDKTIDNDISFSVNDNDKFSVQSKFKEVEDNLSEQFEKSMKNSEISEMTHREMYSKDYFASDQKILKKGRKIVELWEMMFVNNDWKIDKISKFKLNLLLMQ